MMSLHHQLYMHCTYVCVLCVLNLTMGLLKVQLQVPRLLVGLWGTCSLVCGPLCTHFPPDIHPVPAPPRAGGWLILLNEKRMVIISEWEVLLYSYVTVLLSLCTCKCCATGLVFHHSYVALSPVFKRPFFLLQPTSIHAFAYQSWLLYRQSWLAIAVL